MGFQVNLASFLKITFFVEHLQWMPVAKLELSKMIKKSVLAIFDST